MSANIAANAIHERVWGSMPHKRQTVQMGNVTTVYVHPQPSIACKFSLTGIFADAYREQGVPFVTVENAGTQDAPELAIILSNREH